MTPVVLDLFAQIAMARGVRPYELPACYETAISGWRFSFNAHDAPVKDSGGAEVPPYTLLVFRRDWPVMVVDPGGGVVVGGDSSIEDELIRDLRAVVP